VEGNPDIKVAGLSLWLEPADQGDPDGWRHAAAECIASGANVFVRGPILRNAELERWLGQLQELYAGRRSNAVLSCIEPNLSVVITLRDELGHLDMNVDITADHMSQEHVMRFEIDQSYLPRLIQEIRAALP
jgi:hypothetical protein